MSIRNLSAQGLSKSVTFLLLFLTGLTVNTSFAQDSNFTENGFFNQQQAINKLGSRLNKVAVKNRKTSSELRRMLLEDPALHIDQNDKLLYVEDNWENGVGYTSEAFAAPQAAPFPLSQTFALHSRPNSAQKIYLDFNGYLLGATNAWSYNLPSGVAAPFDQDGNPAAFSDAEQTAIQNVWLRMSEDYAPFDVDVTTEDPGDYFYGTRAVFTPTNFMGPGIGGVAYVGVFGTGEYYQPAWIFASATISEKNMAEAASHEVGHTMGLSHDATATSSYYSGHGVWSPIMGVGYYTNISQWSKGEYPNANNFEDDVAIIASYAPVINDDYGNTTATAYNLTGTSFNVSGLITTRTDVDVFKFTTGAGNVSININPAPRGGDLDIKAQILDSAGNVVAVSDPSSYSLNSTFPAGISASFNQTLAAGTYYLTIDGTKSAADDPSAGYSDYASLGQYTISGTVAGNGSQAPVAVITSSATSGTAPLTVNFNGGGSYDPDGTIVGYSWNFGDGSASSNAQNPTHIYLTAGSFTASLTVTDNSGQTGTSRVVIGATNPITTYNLTGTVTYGITPVGQSVKFVPGVVLSASGTSNVSATTNTDGLYSLNNLISGGTYTVMPSKTGGASGITTFDATLILRHVAAGGGVLTGNQLIAADVNDDGRITTFDATQVLRFVASGVQNSTTGQTGNWKFSPAPRSYNAIINSLAGENYEAILLGDVNGSWTSTGAIASDDN